jgi:hypothetical protein
VIQRDTRDDEKARNLNKSIALFPFFTLSISLYHNEFLVCKTSIHRFESGRRLYLFCFLQPARVSA